MQADCFSGNTSLIVRGDGRLEFLACWAYARRKVKNPQTHRAEVDMLEAMMHALYDIETRGKDLNWEQRQGLRQRESTVVLQAIRKWLDSAPPATILPKDAEGKLLETPAIRSDNGSCYISREFGAVLDEHELSHRRIKPHCREENGAMERADRTLGKFWRERN